MGIMKNLVDALSQNSGVYIFKDKNGSILYVGKAKALKKRVLSYFCKAPSDWKIQLLLEEATSIDSIETKTETDALLLEAELVQKYQPKFNILLKNGQPFLYLLFTKNSLEIVRTKKLKGRYCGPFINKQQARSVHEFLINIFKLYRCNKKIENGCLDYHLGKCTGTCLALFDEQEYIIRLELAYDGILQDRKKFLKTLDENIAYYSERLDFEKAKNLMVYKNNMESILETLKTKFSPENYLTQVVHATASKELQEASQDLLKDYQNTAKELQELLNLSQLPIAIDCFDISHFQSSHLVGSCVRFVNGKIHKKSLRKFKIKSIIIQNDYAALQECVQRRYRDGATLPDLILIDGGKGQRNAVLPFVYNVPCVSLAKREELLFSDNHPDGVHLSLKNGYGKLLIGLRDYAHHFAISYHRLLRNNAINGHF